MARLHKNVLSLALRLNRLYGKSVVCYPPLCSISSSFDYQQNSAQLGQLPTAIRHHYTNSPFSARCFGAAATMQSQATVVAFPLAQTGEGIKECELVQWHVEEGQAVQEFDKLCEVQSDKAVVEITSRYAGVVRRRHHSIGDMVQVGDTLVDIEVEAQEAAEVPSELELPRESGTTTDAAQVPSTSAPEPLGTHTAQRKVLASPAVRNFARQNHIEIERLSGTGPSGRITKEDVQAFLDTQTGAGAAAEAAGIPAAATPLQRGTPVEPEMEGHVPARTAYDPQASSRTSRGQETVVPLRGYRRAMVQSMTAANTVPHFHYCDEVDMGSLIRLRAQLKDNPGLNGTKLTFLPFILKALSVALSDFPELNGSLRADAGALVQHEAHNIGIAMATPSGLVVPNIKRVQDRSIQDLAHELGRLQPVAAQGRLSPADLSGGTITVSNVGTIGGTYASPLLVPGEVAIMALGRLQHLPRFGPSGAIENAAVLNVSWGADHRVIDGALLATFSNAWKSYVEAPERLLLKLR